MPQKEMGITPDSELARLLVKLPRPDRRRLLALVQAAPGPRRDKLEKQMRKRFLELGL